MSLMRIPAAGDPTPADLAIADQKHAAVKRAVDKLVHDATAGVIRPGYDPDDIGVWIDVSLNDCLEAALDMTDGADADGLASALTAMLGESVLRLATIRAAR